MNTLILRTVAPFLTALMLLFSVFVLLRGHNEPGGGFTGGLIAASALAIYGMAMGVDEARRALRAHPITFAGFGVVLAALSGALSLAFHVPFPTRLWATFDFDEVEVALSTPMVFDMGVYFVVFGTLTAVALALAADEEDG